MNATGPFVFATLRVRSLIQRQFCGCGDELSGGVEAPAGTAPGAAAAHVACMASNFCF